jgi:peroxiredoxin
MAVRPRLLAVSLLVALAVVGVAGGWAVHRLQADDGVPDDLVLDTPGEYQQPLDGTDAGTGASSAEGARLPDVVLVDAAGAELSTASLVGMPLVVNVWFSTCPPCARELADFATVHGEVGDSVRFVGVNPLDSPDVMQRFAAERGVAYELLLDPDGAFLDGARVSSFPRTFFVDERGVVVGEAGELDAAGLRTRIEELL